VTKQRVRKATLRNKERETEMDITYIQDLVRQGKYALTEHADIRKIQREVLHDDITGAILGGVVVQEYPNHEPYPRVMFRSTRAWGEPIDVVCDVDYDNEMVLVVTVEETKVRRSFRGRREEGRRRR
jgi:hypothetical protein